MSGGRARQLQGARAAADIEGSMGAPSGGGDAVLAAVAFATERLLGAEAWPERLDEVLAHLGAAAGADRVSCYQKVRDPSGRLWMDLRAEWDAPGVPQVFEDPGNHLHPFAPDLVRWIEVLSHGGLVNAIVGELPATERDLLENEHVVSVLAVPVRSGGEWWGFLAFDDCHRPRRWTESEIGALRAVAGALAAALERGLADETRRFAEEQYRSMVEHGPAVTYIDGPDETASTLFISPQVEELLGYTPEEWTSDPGCGRVCSIRTTRPARSPRTSGTMRRASPSASSTGCSTGTVTSYGCTTRRRSFATIEACPATRTV